MHVLLNGHCCLIRNEHRMIVRGLPKICIYWVEKWQEMAKQQVSELVVKLCPDLKNSVVHVQDLTSFSPDRTIYNVTMSSSEASKRVRVPLRDILKVVPLSYIFMQFIMTNFSIVHFGEAKI